MSQAPSRPSFISPLAAAVIFGFASGAVGAIVAIALAPAPAVTDAGALLRPFQGRRPAVPMAVQAATNAIVEFYPQKNLGAGALERSYYPWEAVGAGVVLTSDGWLLGSGSVFPAGKAARRSAVVAGRSYPVEKVVRDPYSGVVFVKIDAANLPVRAFGDDVSLQAGDSLYAFDAERGVRRLEVIGLGPPSAHDRDGLVRSSERLQRLIKISELEALPGAPLLSAGGQIIGLRIDHASAVPLSAFAPIIGDLLKEGAVVRPRLGVNYVDLSRINRQAESVNGRIDSGALMTASADGKRPAVAKESPAAAIGLRAGDVITAVDGEAVSGRKSLADILVGYDSGSAVKLTVRRGNAELSLEAVLGREEGK